MMEDWRNCQNPIPSNGQCSVCDDSGDASPWLSCVLCNRRAHMECLGLGPGSGIITGNIAWSCTSCGPLTKLSTLLSCFNEMEKKLANVMKLSDKVNRMDKEIHYMKTNAGRESRNYSQVAAGNAQTHVNYDDQITIQKPDFSFIKGMHLRNDSVSSNSSSRKKRTRVETPEKKPAAIIGTSDSQTFLGVSKPPPRRHIYVGRISKDYTADDVIKWCNEKDAPLQHIREVSIENGSFRSFHCVFSGDCCEKIENSAFWPKNVVVKRFFLNDNAKTWLKSLSNKP